MQKLKTPLVKQITIWVTTVIITGATLFFLFVAPPDIYILHQLYEVDIITIFLFGVFFVLIFRINGTWKNTISISFTLALFFLSLIYKWKTSDAYFMFGGLLPLSDANAYYAGAQNLNFGLPISGTAAYRPVYTSFLSVLFKLANGNLQTVLILLVVINALAIHAAAREIQKSLRSSLAPATFLILGYLFYRRFSGTLMTENLGFCLGNLALLFLLRGIRLKQLSFILYGIFLLTIALNARAGAFLVLPAITIWAGIIFAKARWSWRAFFLGILAISIGMAANTVLVKLINSPNSKAFANYSFTLYGLASGNKGWEQAGIDHPSANTDKIYQFALDKIRANPFVFIKSVATAYTDYFETSNGAFSFLLLKHDRADTANIILWLLTFAGLVMVFLERKKQDMGLGLALFGGIILSIGLVPPIDAVKMRVYAATIPISCFIIANGFLLPRTVIRQNILQQVDKTDTIYWDFLFSFCVIIASLVLPFIIKSTGNIPTIKDANPTCQEGQQALNISIARGSSILIFPSPSETYAPQVDASRIVTQISTPDQQFTENEKVLISKTILAKHQLVITIIRGYWVEGEEQDGSGKFLITENVPKPGAYIICAKQEKVESFLSTSLPDEAIIPANSISWKININNITQKSIRTIYTIGLSLITGFLFLDLLKVFNLPKNLKIIGILNATLIGIGALVFLHYAGILPLIWKSSNIQLKAIRHRDGYLYTTNLGTGSYSDTLLMDYPARLYENDAPLAPPHESQSLITQYGGGRYIIKGKILFLSTSDNSDPSENNRQYTIQVPLRLRNGYVLLAGILFLLGVYIEIVLLYRYKQF